jgi:hypothetical protein
MSPTNPVIRVLLAIILTVALVIVWAWWYYRPTLEAASAGLSSRSESISIGSSSINLPYLLPYLLTVIVVVVVVVAILKVFR